MGSPTGAIVQGDYQGTGFGGGNYKFTSWRIDASKSNSIYSDSYNSVIPAYVESRYIIKY